MTRATYVILIFLAATKSKKPEMKLLLVTETYHLKLYIETIYIIETIY